MDDAYFPLPARAVIDRNLTKGQLKTLAKIYAFCWIPQEQQFEWTKPMTTKTLATELDQPRRTLADHIPELIALEYLDRHEYSPVVFAITPKANYASSGESPPELAASRPTTTLNLLPQNKDSLTSESLQEIRINKRRGGRRESAKSAQVGEAPPVDAEIVEFLKARGIRPPALYRIPVLEYVDLPYLRAWFDYADLKDWPENEKNGRTISAIYSENPAPEICNVCKGLDGDHGYVIDEENFYISCPRYTHGHLSRGEIFEMFGEVSPAH